VFEHQLNSQNVAENCLEVIELQAMFDVDELASQYLRATMEILCSSENGSEIKLYPKRVRWVLVYRRVISLRGASRVMI
jgi:hypothetical protein